MMSPLHSYPETRRPRLLFLSQVLPFPPDGGVKIRTYHTLRLLSQKFDISALCFYRWKKGRLEQDVKQSIEALEVFGEVTTFPIPQEHSRMRFLRDHLKSIATSRVYTVPTYDSAHFRSEVQNLLQGHIFDLVHADSLDLSGYFPLVRDLPLVCAHHDAQSQLLRRRAEKESSWWKAAYMRHQASLMAKEEASWCPRVALNVTVSEKDRKTLDQVAGGGQFEVFPNGVDIDFFKPSPAPSLDRELVFVGGTTWFPNLDALKFYSASILPIIRELIPDSKTTWVGRATTDEINTYSAKAGLTLTGYVDDIRPYVHRASCYIVPLRVGGGTRLKILDAWAMGKPVVSTSWGCEGLMAADGENILIRDDPRDFAEAVQQVLHDPELRRQLGTNARHTAIDNYGWDAIGQRMVERYLCTAKQ